MTNQVSPTSEAEEVKAWMEGMGFEYHNKSEMWWRGEVSDLSTLMFFSTLQATFIYRIAKQAEIQGRIDELKRRYTDQVMTWEKAVQLGAVPEYVVERVVELEALLSSS